MEIIKKLFKDAYIIKNKFQSDKRGKFIKFKQEIKIRNKKIKFDQFCYSSNKNKYTLRGIHYQKHPDQEEKLITCVEGKILDITFLLECRRKNTSIPDLETLSLAN